MGGGAAPSPSPSSASRAPLPPGAPNADALWQLLRDGSRDGHRSPARRKGPRRAPGPLRLSLRDNPKASITISSASR